MNPLYFWFCMLIFPMLVFLSTGSDLPGLVMHPTPRFEGTLVLAANRTERPDILRGLRLYRAGWDISNRHYLASLGFTGIAGFSLAILWLIFGLALAVYLCYGWGIHINNQGSHHCRRICLMMIILFTSVALIGCTLFFVGQDRFHGEVMDTLDYGINQSDYAVRILRNTTEYFSIAKTVDSPQLPIPSDVMDNIDKLNADLNRVADTLYKRTNENAVTFRIVFKYVHLGLIVGTALILLLALTGLVLCVLGYRRAITILFIIVWLLVATTFIVLGAFMIIDNAISDTCVATGEWAANPQKESALSNVLPCVDQKITNKTLIQSEQVVNNIATLVNQFIFDTVNTNGTQGPLAFGFYNQSGPEIPTLCYPFDAWLQERHCEDDEVSSANVSRVWKNFVCEISESSDCTTVGRLTPMMYTLLVDAVNKSYALEHYTPLLLGLENCNFARDAITGFISSHCPPLNYSLKITNVGLGLISASVLLCLVLWIVYVKLLLQ